MPVSSSATSTTCPRSCRIPDRLERDGRPAAPAGPNALRIQEFLLATFNGLGLDLPSALRYAHLLDGYVVGQALQWAEERRMWHDNALVTIDDVRTQVRCWAPVDGDDHPLSLRSRDNLLAGSTAPLDHDEQFDLGLACLLDGIAARLPG